MFLAFVREETASGTAKSNTEEKFQSWCFPTLNKCTILWRKKILNKLWYWLYRSLKWWWLTKKPFKNRENQSFRWFLWLFWPPRNYVSMRKQDKRCIALKLCGANFESTIVPRGALWSSKTPRGKFAVNLCPAEFWSLWSAPRGIMEPLKCAPQSLGAMQLVPAFSWRLSYGCQISTKTLLKLRLSLFFKVIFVSHCHFRDL